MKKINVGIQNCKYVAKDYCTYNKRRLSWCILLFMFSLIIGILFAVWLFDSETHVTIFINIDMGSASVFGEMIKYLILPTIIVVVAFFSLRKSTFFFISLALFVLHFCILFYNLVLCFLCLEIGTIMFAMFSLLSYSVITLFVMSVVLINTYNFIRTKRTYFITFNNTYLIFIIIDLIGAFICFPLILGTLCLIF